MYKSIKRISVKDVIGEINAEELPKKGTKDLMRVVGIATGIKRGISAYGEWVALKGSFSAIDNETGEEYRSNTCFVPEEITDKVALKLAEKETRSVDFAIDITITAAKTATGYEYGVVMLKEVGIADPLEALMSGLPKIKGLPEPEKKSPEKKSVKK